MIGLDTGFFLELVNGNNEATRLWESCLDDQVDFAVCALSLFEVERLAYSDGRRPPIPIDSDH